MTAAAATQPVAPRFKRVCPGLYDSTCGRFTMHQVPGVNPPGWNVEWTTDYTYEHQYTGDAVERAMDLRECVVDGAATYRDAKHFFASWWAAHGAALVAAEAAL